MAVVLVVEDDADAAAALAEVLGMEGHEVRVAFDGEQGFSLLHERLPDLVLLDIEMPILNGPGMATRMLVHNAGMENVPILLVSGAPDLRRVAAEVGTPYFLGKPHTYEQLMGLVARALHERTPPKLPHPQP
jgi:DNA-binding response OmpR family regulator